MKNNDTVWPIENKMLTTFPDNPRLLCRVASVLLTLNVAGFVLVSFLPEALSLNNRLISIPFRAVAAALCVYLIYTTTRLSRLRSQPHILDLVALVFWSLYLLRFCIDSVFDPVPLGMDSLDFAEYLLGASLLTYIAFSSVTNVAIYRKAFDWIIFVLGCNCVLSFIFHSHDISAGSAQERLGANDLISPITYGHMGVTTLLFGVFMFLGISTRDRTITRSLFGLLLMVLGSFALLASASRGPLLAGCLLLVLLLVIALRHGATARVIVILLFMGLVLPSLVGVVMTAGVPLQQYFGSSAAFLESDSTANREGLESAGWNEFLERPILGSSLVERESLTYPHNYVIESFMATGMLGGVMFSILALAGIWRSFVLIYRCPGDGWISILFLQSLIGGMFSGGLFFAPWFWGMLGIVLFAGNKHEATYAVETPRRRNHSCIAMQSIVPVDAASVSDAIVT